MGKLQYISKFVTGGWRDGSCVRMWRLSVETGTRSYKLSGCTLCIINLRSQSSLQIPNHTISYAFCIYTCIIYETEDSAKSSDSYTVLYAVCMYSVATCMNLRTWIQSSDSYTKVCLIQVCIENWQLSLPFTAPVHYPICRQSSASVPSCFIYCFQWLPPVM